MNKKYIIKEEPSFMVWHDLSKQSPQYTAFNCESFIKGLRFKYKTFLVYKNEELKASFCILLSGNNDVVNDEFFIYNNIMFVKDCTHKNTKSRHERFVLTELIIEYLVANYNNIKMSLSPEFEDMRPFLWYKYHENEKHKFSLDLRYTSYIDISELKNNYSLYDTNLFQEFETLRQRHIRKGRRDGAITVLQSNINDFVLFYKDLMRSQDVCISDSKIDKITDIITYTMQSADSVMFTTRNGRGDIIYITIFLIDKYRAYYLFGAGNKNTKENFKGTVCFWDSFNILANQYNVNVVDMEGVNSPQRGWFKLSFGGELKPYYKLSLNNKITGL